MTNMAHFPYWIRIIILIPLLAIVFTAELRAEDTSRPGANKGPTEVKMRMYVADVDNVNVAEQRFTANVYYLVQWHDPHLAHKDNHYVTVPLSKVWNPRLQILNQQRTWKTFPEVVEVSPEGTVFYYQRVWGDFSQPLELHRFPFDKQTFEIQLVAVGYSPENLTLVVDWEKPSGIAKKFSLPDWNILGWTFENTPYKALPDMPHVAGVTFSIQAVRHVNYYILKFAIPLILIVFMSLVALWIDPADSSTRISVAVTSMLTLIAYRFIMGGELPKISYLTRLDLFIIASTLLVFATLVVTAITSVLVRRNKLPSARFIDTKCRWIFPIAFLFILVLPFLVY